MGDGRVDHKVAGRFDVGQRVFFRSVAFAQGSEDYHGRVRPERVEEAERGEIHASLSVDARHPSNGPRRDAGSEQSVDVDRLGRSDFDFHVGTSGNKKTQKVKTNTCRSWTASRSFRRFGRGSGPRGDTCQ